MKAHTLIYDTDSFGITGKSLQVLRNALARAINHEIVVSEIATNHILCGFLIFDKTAGEITWSGDGFRTDRGGEGGRGYEAANKLLEFYGIRPLNIFADGEPSNLDFYKALLINYSEAMRAKDMLKACNEMADKIEDEEFRCYYEEKPWY